MKSLVEIQTRLENMRIEVVDRAARLIKERGKEVVINYLNRIDSELGHREGVAYRYIVDAKFLETVTNFIKNEREFVRRLISKYEQEQV